MDTEADIKTGMDVERKRQALADLLHLDKEAITPCAVRVNDLNTFQVERKIYLVGREEEVHRGVRGYFENNLGELDSAFINYRGSLSDVDASMVQRLCEILNEPAETEVLNQALLGIVRRCGDLDSILDAAAADANRSDLLSEDGKEIPFGDFLIYRFKDGQCSDFEH